MPDGVVYSERDRHISPPARWVRKRRIVLTANVQHNAALLGRQVRCTSGCTEAPHMLNKDGRLAWKRVAQVLQPQGAKTRHVAPPAAARVFDMEAEPPAASGRARRTAADMYPRLIGQLRWLAANHQEMPFLAELCKYVNSGLQSVVPALERLHAEKFIELELTEHRPGFRRHARVTVPGVGTIETPGWPA